MLKNDLCEGVVEGLDVDGFGEVIVEVGEFVVGDVFFYVVFI